MPVVTPRAASTETVKSVRCFSRFCTTIRCKPSCSARSLEIGTQIKPRPCVAMKLTASGVTFSAAITKSPSFSRSASWFMLKTDDEMYRVVAHLVRRFFRLEIERPETAVAASGSVKLWIEVKDAVALQIHYPQIGIT